MLDKWQCLHTVGPHRKHISPSGVPNGPVGMHCHRMCTIHVYVQLLDAIMESGVFERIEETGGRGVGVDNNAPADSGHLDVLAFPLSAPHLVFKLHPFLSPRSGCLGCCPIATLSIDHGRGLGLAARPGRLTLPKIN